jgi:hypothetical protein
MKTKVKNQVKGVMSEIIENKFQKSLFDIFLANENIPFDQNMGVSPNFYSQYVGIIKSNPKANDLLSFITSNCKVMYKDLTYAMGLYQNIISNPTNKELFETMALLETIIIQGRCMINTDVKLTLLNQKRGESETSYIVARAPFYNPENVKAEIRAYLGKAEDLGSDINKLSQDTSFMLFAQQQIVKAMSEVMNDQKIMERIKKSSKVKVNELVYELDGDSNETSSIEMKKKSINRLDPYNPGKGISPTPKTLGLLSKKKKG